MSFTDDQIEALIKDADTALVKLPKSMKGKKAAATEALEEANGDAAAALALMSEKLGVKKYSRAKRATDTKAEETEAPTKKVKADAEDDGNEHSNSAAAAAAAAPASKLEPEAVWTYTTGAAAEMKELAVRLMHAGRERGIKLPTEDKAATVMCGKLIMTERNDAERSVNADACLAMLKQDRGTTVEEEEAPTDTPSKKKSKAAECKVPANQPILAIFREFQAYYFKEQEAQKGATFAKAGTAIKDCEWEITLNNLPTDKKGPKKLANLGKSSIEKIKEFLETGTVQRLEEIRAGTV